MGPRNLMTAGATIFLTLSFLCLSTVSRAAETNGGSTAASSTDTKAAPALAGNVDSNTCQMTVERMVNGTMKSVPMDPPPAKMKIYADDKVKTENPTGCKATIILGDGTKLSLTANASITIDKFVNAGPGGVGDVAISYAAGTFAWASGNMKPNSYSVNSDLATIGIRGTAFTISTENAGKQNEQENIVVTSGSVFITSKMTARLSIVKAGQKVRITASDGKVSKPAFVKL
jgi:hypothetical protein